MGPSSPSASARQLRGERPTKSELHNRLSQAKLLLSLEMMPMELTSNLNHQTGKSSRQTNDQPENVPTRAHYALDEPMHRDWPRLFALKASDCKGELRCHVHSPWLLQRICRLIKPRKVAPKQHIPKISMIPPPEMHQMHGGQCKCPHLRSVPPNGFALKGRTPWPQNSVAIRALLHVQMPSSRHHPRSHAFLPVITSSQTHKPDLSPETLGEPADALQPSVFPPQSEKEQGRHHVISTDRQEVGNPKIVLSRQLTPNQP